MRPFRSASGRGRIRSRATGCTDLTDVTQGDLTAITEKTIFYTVIGVVADIKLHDLTEGGKSVGAYYFSTALIR